MMYIVFDGREVHWRGDTLAGATGYLLGRHPGARLIYDAYDGRMQTYDVQPEYEFKHMSDYWTVLRMDDVSKNYFGG